MSWKRNVYERFNEMLDGLTPSVKIGNLTYLASTVLKEVDPIAYEEWLLEYLMNLDSEGLFCYECEIISSDVYNLECECDEE
tara:strand:- start:3242 stop:3487 length:246 start_codon:yes stop_codon:yes gene_type:complete